MMARNAYLAGRGEKARRTLLEQQRRIGAVSGVDLDRDLLAPLGAPLVCHDYPPARAATAVAVTLVTPIRATRVVRGPPRHLAGRSATGAGRRQRRPISLVRDADGVWRWSWPVFGPAWRCRVNG